MHAGEALGVKRQCRLDVSVAKDFAHSLRVVSECKSIRCECVPEPMKSVVSNPGVFGVASEGSGDVVRMQWRAVATVQLLGTARLDGNCRQRGFRGTRSVVDSWAVRRRPRWCVF